MRKIYIQKELSDIYGITEILKPAGVLIKNTQNQEKPSKKVNVKTRGNIQAAKAEPKSSDNAYKDWNVLLSAVNTCNKCILASTRTKTVPGEGNQKAELMFIGEGPGADEDRTGRPFVGRAGELLTKMIAAMGYKREEVYIANIVKCRPPGNRDPFDNEVSACIGYLHAQINFIKPKVIVCLGNTAACHLLRPDKRISRLRGSFHNYNGIKVMPTYHPSYLLRNESKKRDVWNDLQLVMAELGKIHKQP